MKVKRYKLLSNNSKQKPWGMYSPNNADVSWLRVSECPVSQEKTVSEITYEVWHAYGRATGGVFAPFYNFPHNFIRKLTSSSSLLFDTKYCTNSNRSHVWFHSKQRQPRSISLKFNYSLCQPGCNLYPHHSLKLISTPFIVLMGWSLQCSRESVGSTSETVNRFSLAEIVKEVLLNDELPYIGSVSKLLWNCGARAKKGETETTIKTGRGKEVTLAGVLVRFFTSPLKLSL